MIINRPFPFQINSSKSDNRAFSNSLYPKLWLESGWILAVLPKIFSELTVKDLDAHTEPKL